MRIYVVGNVVRCSGSFSTASGTAVDPDTVAFSLQDPEGTITIYEYPVDAELVKDSTGNYHVDVSTDLEGMYSWRLSSTGDGQAAFEGHFGASYSPFVP